MDRLLALFGAVTISFSAILVRLAHVSPATAAFYRPAYGLLPLVVLALVARPAQRRSLRQRVATMAAGMLMGLAFVFWNYSIVDIGAGAATVLSNTQVVFVGVVAWLLMGERPTAIAFVAVPVVFGGVALTSGLGLPGAYGAAPVLGALWALANATVYAAFLLLFRTLNRSRGLPAGLLLDASLGAAAATLVTGLLTDPGFSLAFRWPAHGWLLLLGLGPQVIGWLLILTALPRLPALVTSVTLLAQPMLTVLWGRLIFAERLSWVQAGGVAMVLLGVLALSLGGTVHRRARSGRPAEASGAAD
ncbi:MAG TPA: DMT family transporter [Trueperaceae bacterium]|nr:DMT family transporter [Trueperaceae bacterium]